MEARVGFHVVVDVAARERGVEVGVDRPDLAQQRRADVRQRERRRFGLDQPPAAQHLVEPLGCHRWHRDLALRADLDRAFRRQPAERVAHRHLADAELLRDPARRQRDPRRDAAGDQAPAQLFVSAGAERVLAAGRSLAQASNSPTARCAWSIAESVYAAAPESELAIAIRPNRARAITSGCRSGGSSSSHSGLNSGA